MRKWKGIESYQDARLINVQEKTNEIARGKINPFYQNHHRNDNGHKKKDPDAMDVDAVQLSNQEHRRRLQERLCFKCGKAGHFSNTCRNPFAKREGK